MGGLAPDKPSDDTITLADFAPHSFDVYESLSPDGGSFEPRAKPPQTLGISARSAEQHFEVLTLFPGRAHCQARLAAISISRQIHEAEPEAFSSNFLMSA